MTEDALAEPRGTFACPICGYDKPHHHPDEQVAAYREDQMRADGWTSVTHRQPKKSGWYLCVGVSIDPDQYGRPKNFGDNPKWSQLSWFKWVRDAAMHAAGAAHVRESEMQEVLFYDARGERRGWFLRNFLGNAVPSGAESRYPTYAHPAFWRELPAIPLKPETETL